MVRPRCSTGAVLLYPLWLTPFRTLGNERVSPVRFSYSAGLSATQIVLVVGRMSIFLRKQILPCFEPTRTQ